MAEVQLCEKHKIEMHQPECSCEDGSVECPGCDFCISGDHLVTCWKCNGSGISPWRECDFCNEEVYEEDLVK